VLPSPAVFTPGDGGRSHRPVRKFADRSCAGWRSGSWVRRDWRE
jgi:hypothetical protein